MTKPIRRACPGIADAIDEDSRRCSIEVHEAQQGTPVTDHGRNRTIQPRHRARDGSLLGFMRELNPAEFEWMVDKVSIKVNGSWQARAAETFFRDQLGIPAVDWFTRPTLESGNLVISTNARGNSTIGDLKLAVRNLTKTAGDIKLTIQCNPTRTLAHIMAEAPAPPDLTEYLASLDVFDFFASAAPSSIAESRDRETNWLSAPQNLRNQLTGNIADIFLPIFFEKLRVLVGRLLGVTSIDDGTDQVMVYTSGETVRVAWGQAMVPQVETYFERYHSSAVLAVRRASMKILDADHTNTVTMYSEAAQFERRQDSFKLVIPIMVPRKLVIYAKTDTRVRFEVRRDKKGRYGDLPVAAVPSDRLLNIIAHERSEASRVCNWPDVGSLFDDADSPSFTQLVDFLATVASVCTGTDASIDKVVRLLLTEGSLSEPAQTTTLAATMAALESAGVVARLKVRRRDLRNTMPRYALAEQHHDLRERLLAIFHAPQNSNSAVTPV